jgi:knotted carbamoyltransferase YgeW
MSASDKLIKELAKFDVSNYGYDFLLTWLKSDDEILATLKVAQALRALRDENVSPRLFDSGVAVSLFRDNSTRTRFSFTSACSLLGLQMQDLDEGKSQIAHGETVRETANMISFLAEVVGIRDDMYLGAGHTYMKEVAESLDFGKEEGVLPQRPSVVNLQCDVDHPTQSMADLLHLQTHFGSLEKLRGKTIAMTWAYSPSYGKPLSVPQGIIGLMTRFGMNVRLAHPEGYNLIPDVVKVAGKNAKKSGGSFQVSNSMEDAFKDADIVYPKSWAPYAVMGRRTELLRKNDHAGLKDLEKECLGNNAKFKSWECDAAKMKLTKGGKALYMHCLPADISGVSCKEGEVSADVFDKYRVPTYLEAGWKPYIIASMILLGRTSDPVKALKQMQKRKQWRTTFAK